jgi:hypothetical protein
LLLIWEGPDLWPHRQPHAQVSTVLVDHAAWGNFLGNYLITGHASGNGVGEITGYTYDRPLSKP